MTPQNEPVRRLLAVDATGAPQVRTPPASFASSGGDGGGMDDLLRRLHTVETSVSDIRAQVSGLAATAAHLATKSDVSTLESTIIKWIVSSIITTAVAAFGIAKFFI